MNKLSFVLITAAGLALVAGAAAAPALAEISIQFGPPTYYQPNYGYTRQPYGPYYGQYPQGYTLYSSPPSYNYYGQPRRGYYTNTYSYPYYNSYGQYEYPGYSGR